jgi:hypothetical protein
MLSVPPWLLWIGGFGSEMNGGREGGFIYGEFCWNEKVLNCGESEAFFSLMIFNPLFVCW